MVCSDPKRMVQKRNCSREGCSKLASNPVSEQVHCIASFTQTQSSTCPLTGTRTFPFPAPTQAASDAGPFTALHQARPHVLRVLQGRFGDIVTTRVCTPTSTSGDLRRMGLGDTRIHKSQHLGSQTKECPQYQACLEAELKRCRQEAVNISVITFMPNSASNPLLYLGIPCALVKLVE